MLGIDRSLSRTTGDAAPAPLPVVYDALAEKGCLFRRGQISMVAGSPGSGKSMFAQFHAIKAKVPTIYFSADTDEHTMAIRAAACVTGYHQSDIARLPPHQLEPIAQQLRAETSFIDWVYESDLPPEAIEEHIRAFAMVYGDWPHLIVFDVLMSYQVGAGDWQATNDFMLTCKSLTSMTNAHVMILHHVVGYYTDRSEAPPRSAIINKADQLPSVILTIGRQDAEWRLACVKNRTAPADPRAEHPIVYGLNASTVQVTEPRAWSYA